MKKEFPKALKLGPTGVTHSAPELFTDSYLLITHTSPKSTLQGSNIVLKINKVIGSMSLLTHARNHHKINNHQLSV